MGLSVDSVPSLKAWAESLGGISYPLLSDFYPHGQAAQAFGVLRSEGYSERAIFVIDKQGVIRYIDVHDIGEQPDNEVLFRVLAELEPRLAAQATFALSKAPPLPTSAAQPLAVPAAEADVIIYCTPWCPDCKRARAYFTAHGIRYAEIDISRDRDAARQVRAWANGREVTPTFDVKGTIIVDFNQVKLAKALGITG